MNPNPLQGRTAVVVFACFAAGYFLSFALRSVNAVIAPELTQEFGLSNAQLGSLSSAYFFAFSLLQLPLGIWLDRYGSRRVNAGLLLVSAVGCAVFATAPNVTALWAGRALIGAGVAGALMAALKGYRFWYPPMRLQQLTAWMLMAGTAGALSATVPVQRLLPLLGWRGVFWAVGLLLLVVSVAMFRLVPRDEERATAVNAARAAASARPGGYAEVFRDPYFWRFGVLAVLPQASYVSLQTLWAGPWFVEVLGMSSARAAEALFAFSLASVIGFSVQSWLLPRVERARWSMVRYAAIGMSAMMSMKLLISLVDAPWAWALWVPLALSATCFPPVQTHVSLSFRPELTGRVYTSLNMVLFVSIFLTQWLFGVAIDLLEGFGWARAQAFRTALLWWLVFEAAALAWLLTSKSRPPIARQAAAG